MIKPLHLSSAILVFAMAGTANAVPTDFAFNQVPSRFETRELTVGSRALGEVCLSRAIMPDGTVCNPAFLGEADESSLLARVYIGNGYAAISTADSFVNKPVTKDFLQQLFIKQNTTSLEANAGLVFTTRYFSASFAPYRVQYVSEVHNPNFPVIAVHAAIERSFSFSGALPLSTVSSKLAEFSLGTRLRLLDRTYVHGSFSLFDAISETPQSLLPVHNQKAVLLDPTLGWYRGSSPWKLRGSVGLSNVGRAWPDDALYPERTDIQAGIGIEPPTGFGRLKLGLDLVNLLHATNFGSRFRFGTSYQFGILESMMGFNSNSFATGFIFGIQLVQVGIVYEFTRSDLGEGPFENKIATEVSIRL